MQSLLSKDLLYPAIKELADKYPDWLAQNRSSLSDSDFNKFNKQFDIVQKICHEYESGPAQSEDQFQKVMSLMQAMQTLGNPPKDLVGDGPDNNFLPQEQCPVS